SRDGPARPEPAGGTARGRRAARGHPGGLCEADSAPLGCFADRARRGVSGALSLAIRFSKAECRTEGLAIGVSAPREVLTVRSRATQAREPGQVRKEAALSGNYGCRGSA